MKKASNTLALFLLLCAATLAWSAERKYYQWTDEKGTVHMTDTPPPADVREKARVRELREAPPAGAPEPAPQASPAAVPPPPPSRARPALPPKPPPELLPYSRVSVTLYSAVWCGVCRKARAFLQELGVSLTEIDVEKNPDPFRRIQEQLRRKTGVPVIDIEGKVFVGFSRKTVAAEIEKRRIPKD